MVARSRTAHAATPRGERAGRKGCPISIDEVAVPLHAEAEAVLLDLVKPSRAGGNLGSCGRDAELNKIDKCGPRIFEREHGRRLVPFRPGLPEGPPMRLGAVGYRRKRDHHFRAVC